MSDLLSLAARVEAAEGPERELDALIAEAVGRDYDLIRASGLWPKELSPDQAEARRKLHIRQRAEAFTASLDAAMTLVPEGWLWSISPAAGSYYASVSNDEYLSAEAATPALALCAASLKARAAS